MKYFSFLIYILCIAFFPMINANANTPLIERDTNPPDKKSEFEVPDDIKNELDAILGNKPKPKPKPELPPPGSKLTDNDLLNMVEAEQVEREIFPVKIKGRVLGHRGLQAQIILYTDPVSKKQVDYSLYIQKDGRFETTVNIYEPTSGKLVYGARTAELFIQPGNELTINFQGQDFMRSLSFHGSGADENKFMKNLRFIFREEDAHARRRVSTYSPKRYKEMLDESFAKKNDFFERETKSGDFSDTFLNFAKSDIDYWYAYSLDNYPWERPLYSNTEPPMEIELESFFDFEKNISVSNEDALHNDQYSYYLGVFFDNMKRLDENKGLTDLELADKYLKGKVKYYYQCKRLYGKCISGKMHEVTFEIQKFMEECPHDGYKASLQRVVAEQKGLVEGMQAPDFKLMNLEGETVSMEDYKGKIIYLDYWATWCQSCIHQIHNSNYLWKKFQGKDVVFLYVSLDERQEEWKKYIKYSKKIEGIHLHAEGGMNSEIAKNYFVKKLPAVFLIDKNGTVSQSPAKPPTDTGIVDQISRLLEAR